MRNIRLVMVLVAFALLATACTFTIRQNISALRTNNALNELDSSNYLDGRAAVQAAKGCAAGVPVPSSDLVADYGGEGGIAFAELVGTADKYDYPRANLDLSDGDATLAIWQQWSSDPVKLAVILDPRWDSIGVGQGTCSSGDIYITAVLRDDPVGPGCVINSTFVSTVASQAECDALVSLYNATTGPSWTNSHGWDTATDPCFWDFVQCDLNGITSLHMADNQLSGSIPPEIGNLTNLTFLGMDINLLSGSIPPEIGSLTNLTYLGLSGNLLSGSIPPEIGNLTNLTFLGIADNQLSGSIPPEIGNLTNLTFLSLLYNLLGGDITSAMTGLQDTITDLAISDGVGGNNCFTVTDSALATWLTSREPSWDECDILYPTTAPPATQRLCTTASPCHPWRQPGSTF